MMKRHQIWQMFELSSIKQTEQLVWKSSQGLSINFLKEMINSKICLKQITCNCFISVQALVRSCSSCFLPERNKKKWNN